LKLIQVGHDLIFKDDYIIAKVGERNALIDTGCPLTGSDGEPMRLFGKKVSRSADFGGFSLSETSQMMGIRLDLIIGMDVLGVGRGCSTGNGRSSSSSGRRRSSGEPWSGTAEPAGPCAGRVRVGGQRKTALLDTGAPSSSRPLITNAAIP